MCCCDGPSPEFTSESSPQARSKHLCCECLRVILPGETYERYSGKWDGELTTYKTCRDCLEMRHVVYAECSCWLFAGMYNELDDLPEYEAWGELRDIRAKAINFNARERRRLKEAGVHPDEISAQYPRHPFYTDDECRVLAAQYDEQRTCASK